VYHDDREVNHDIEPACSAPNRQGRNPSYHAETSDEPLGEEHVPRSLRFALLGLVILPVLIGCRAEQPLISLECQRPWLLVWK
jgi:hypothetical protein